MQSFQNLQSNDQLKTGNPQTIGGGQNLLNQQEGLQSTANFKALDNSNVGGIPIDISGISQEEVTAYVSQQVAPPPRSSKIGWFAGLGITSLIVATVLWYIGWRTLNLSRNRSSSD
ncbi:hypothetical protein HY003_00245 [Candidatus Saccharibacteria bacterium]|nr:hypothetical protein [Candidatus Saccharibacteria bacterium]MBI3337721.1 hypothetical protein [Candidatus Saccharibacteria bacterium]